MNTPAPHLPGHDELRALFPDEVVTRARVRDVELPYGAGTLALITLDNGHDHTKPSTFGPAGLLELNAALDAVAARDDLAAVGVTGKPFIFAVGADLKGVEVIERRDQARGIAQLGHAVFRRLGELPIPAFAFVNGAAMGGGLEVALHCTYRTISAGVTAVALPEAFLGLVPGWGGTYLLPRLIGPAKALKVITENALSQNRMIRGQEALQHGYRGCDLRARRFPGRVAALGGAGAHRRGHGEPGGDHRGLGAGRRGGPVVRRREAARRRARAVPGDRPGGGGRRPVAGRGVRGRGRGAGRPHHERRAAGQPVCVRPDPEAGPPPGRRAG